MKPRDHHDLERQEPLTNRLGQGDDEFPHRSSLPEINRRDLLKFMGASMALAGVAGCRSAFIPQRKLVPYVEQPGEAQPGDFIYYRTAAVRHGYAFGVHVATREGRPIKIEGNPDHPASLGSCDPVTMSETLTFYDPDRARSVTYHGDPSDWDAFLAEFQHRLGNGEGVRILMGSTTSPTLARQRERIAAKYPRLRIHTFEPLARTALYEAATLAYGIEAVPIYRFSEAKVVLLIDFDLERAELGGFRYATELMGSRRDQTMNRIYSVHTAPNLAAGFADHTRALSPAQIRKLVRDLVAGNSDDPWTLGVLADLNAHRGRAVVAAGEYLPAEVQAAVHVLNARLGAPVDLIAPVEVDTTQSLDGLVEDMNAGRVKTLLILEGNPAYDAPAELGFGEALKEVEFKVHYSLYPDETSALCDWHLPATHFFEHWTDARAFDGTVTIAQPLIEPLFTGRSIHELFATLLDDSRPPLEIVQETWRGRLAGNWDRVVMRGVVPNSATSPMLVALNAGFDPLIGLDVPAPEFELSIRPDPYIGDGKRANNGWLQELGKPLSSITWSNAVIVSPDTANELELQEGQWVEISTPAGQVSGPAWIDPNHAGRCATVHLGYGRTTGEVAAGLGFSAYRLQHSGTPFLTEAKLRPLAKVTEFAVLQRVTDLKGRDLIHEHNVGTPIESDPLDEGPTLYELTDKQETELPEQQWGMSIDLSTCVGCNACVAACVAENNIPVVGPEQVIVGRHMHWIRVDHYNEGDRTYYQPVPCMHCETAPCEPVCPVAATVHSHDGLNQMIYNRCVGTRYCSNNCPYKVRRFNFLEYDLKQPNFNGRGLNLLRLLNNPDVTVRSRGVMEKCTYCVQRISRARIEAKKDNRPIRDGEIQTACQQACPTEAIVFGNLADRASRARKLRDDARTYALLKDLNTRPRTTYLAKLRNPNPEMPNA